MPKHPAYILKQDGRVAVFIPSIASLFEIPAEAEGQIPTEMSDPRPFRKGCSSKGRATFEPTSCTLVVTGQCNLKCSYCYEDAGEEDCSKSFEPMPKEIAKATIDLCLNNIKKRNLKTLNVRFFGGEPTQALDVVQFAVEYAKEVAASDGIAPYFGMTTNGACEESVANWLAGNINRITFSIDGPKRIHDIQRYGSFDTVIRTGKILYDSMGGRLTLRITVSEMSVQELPSSVEFLLEQFPKSQIMIEPLFGIGRGKNEWCSPPEYSDFFEALLDSMDVAERHKGKVKCSLTNFNSLASGSFCGASGKGFLVNSDGDVYSCNRMIYADQEPAQPRFRYGKYNSKDHTFEVDQESYQWLSNMTFGSIPKCSGCFAKHMCRGDCPANKAVIYPDDFHRQPSYRCEEIKSFLTKYLFHRLDNTK